MQTQKAIMVNNSNVLQSIPSGGGAGWVTRLLGCWHKEMSRPFSHKGQAYRTCLSCGASRKFNVGSWEMQGSFYYSRPNITTGDGAAAADGRSRRQAVRGARSGKRENALVLLPTATASCS